MPSGLLFFLIFIRIYIYKFFFQALEIYYNRVCSINLPKRVPKTKGDTLFDFSNRTKYILDKLSKKVNKTGKLQYRGAVSGRREVSLPFFKWKPLPWLSGENGQIVLIYGLNFLFKILFQEFRGKKATKFFSAWPFFMCCRLFLMKLQVEKEGYAKYRISENRGVRHPLPTMQVLRKISIGLLLIVKLDSVLCKNRWMLIIKTLIRKVITILKSLRSMKSHSKKIFGNCLTTRYSIKGNLWAQYLVCLL